MTKTIKSPAGRRAPTRKERERSMRRGEILVVARHLFARQGYHATTLEEIARRAEFGKGTIYNYFPSKDDLFRAIIDEIFSEVTRIAEDELGGRGNVEEVIRGYSGRMIHYYKGNSDLFRILMREINLLESGSYDKRMQDVRRQRQSINSILAGVFRRGIQARRIRPFDPLKMAEIFNSTLQSFCAHTFKEPAAADDAAVDEYADFITGMIFNGIAIRKS
jgi:TetR/AcrR family transcriptional regulator, repressor of fatR-cypB operon